MLLNDLINTSPINMYTLIWESFNFSSRLKGHSFIVSVEIEVPVFPLFTVVVMYTPISKTSLIELSGSLITKVFFVSV